MKAISRVCACCKESFYIDEQNIDEVIYYDKKYYHSNCFINICNKRSQSKSENISSKWTKIKNSLNEIKKESRKYIIERIYEDKIYNFILESYGITFVPKTIFQKLADIYSGTWRGMSIGIQPEHLLDMWTKKMNYLNKVANNNVSKGMNLNEVQRILYDLSILISKYDSYLKYIEKQQIIESEKVEDNSEMYIGKTICTPYVNKINNEEDISDLVDDIFG